MHTDSPFFIFEKEDICSLPVSGAMVYFLALTECDNSSMLVTEHLASLKYAGRNDPSALAFKFTHVKSSPLLCSHQFLYLFAVRDTVLRSRWCPVLKNFIADAGLLIHASSRSFVGSRRLKFAVKINNKSSVSHECNNRHL